MYLCATVLVCTALAVKARSGGGGQHGAASSADANRPVRFDLHFAGFRARLRGVDEQTLLTLSEDDVATAARESLAWLDWASVYDGRMWGTDSKSVAALWHSLSRNDADPSLRFFDNPEPPRYPATTRIMGRNSEFAWQGHCHLIVEVRRTDDHTVPLFWSDIGVIERLASFSTDAVHAWSNLRADEFNGTQISETQTLSYGGQRTMHRILSDNGAMRCSMWLDVDSNGTLTKWTLAIPNAHDSNMLCYSIRIRKAVDSHQRLPVRPSDLTDVYRDIDGIESVSARDYTGFGTWKSGRVEYVSRSIYDLIAEQWASNSLRIIVTASIGVLTLAIMLHEHTQFTRRAKA